MASPAPSITLSSLTTQPAIDSVTISLYLQLTFGAGYYTVGGVPAGVAAFAAALGIDTVPFLFASIHGEDPVTTSPAVGGVTYKYNSGNDTIQLFVNGVEFTASEVIPATVLNDIVVGLFTWDRI